MATFLSLFDHKVREHSKLTRQEVHAITAFLTARVREFALFESAESQLRQLVQQSVVLDVGDECASDEGGSDDSIDLLAQVRGVRTGSHSRVGSCAGRARIVSFIGAARTCSHRRRRVERVCLATPRLCVAVGASRR
jgi:hypothetical protein